MITNVHHFPPYVYSISGAFAFWPGLHPAGIRGSWAARRRRGSGAAAEGQRRGGGGAAARRRRGSGAATARRRRGSNQLFFPVAASGKGSGYGCNGRQDVTPGY